MDLLQGIACDFYFLFKINCSSWLSATARSFERNLSFKVQRIQIQFYIFISFIKHYLLSALCVHRLIEKCI